MEGAIDMAATRSDGETARDASSRGQRAVLAVFVLALALHAFMARDIAFISDEPVFLMLAAAANQSGRLSMQGLVGSFGVVYSPACVWFYQLLLAVTPDVAALATLKIAISAGALAFAMWHLRALTRLTPWPLLLIPFSPFVAYYQRMLWDNVLLIPVSALMVAATAAFLSAPATWRLWVVVALCAIGFHVHILAVAPIAACVATIVVFRAAWIRAHAAAFGLAALAAFAAAAPYLYAIAVQQEAAARSRASAARALAGVWHGILYWSHQGFEPFMQSFYRDSAVLRGLQLATGWMAVLAVGAALAGFAVWAVRNRALLAAWPLDRQLALLATFVVLGQAALFVGLGLEPHWHYSNSGWFGSFYLIWWGFDRVKGRLWARTLLAAQTAAVGAMTAMLAVHIHNHHGDRSLLYGATLGNQMDVARQIVDRRISGVSIAVANYAAFPQGLQFLVFTRARKMGVDMSAGTGRAVVRYATPSGDDGRIEVVIDDAPRP